MEPTDNETTAERFILPRLKAVLALKELTLHSLARRLDVSERHLWFVVTGERRPSERVRQGIKRVLGQDGWQFACGHIDTLTAKGRG